MAMFCRVIMTLVKACLIIYVLMYFWLETFENREMMKAVVHWQAKNYVSILTFYHDKISDSGSYSSSEYDSMSEEEKANTNDEEEA